MSVEFIISMLCIFTGDSTEECMLKYSA